MVVNPRALVPPPPHVPAPFGLFSVLTFRSLVGADGAPIRIQNGVEWESASCEVGQFLQAEHCPPNGSLVRPRYPRSAGGIGEASSFTVYGSFKCSPVGFDPAAAQAKATENLLIKEEFQVSKHFGYGSTDNVPNLRADAIDLIPGATVAPAHALGALEQNTANKYGSVGTLYMMVDMASRMLANQMLHTVGKRLLTGLGTPVVAGPLVFGGAPASDATGTRPDSWIYASPALFGYRSEIFTDIKSVDLFDHGTNEMQAVADRTYVIGYDPCPGAVAAVHVDVDVLC